ncbi:NAD(P)/FAD-dependent oxidoreductase [Arenibacter sp. 6A1]|uniref:NAD(P)/FAD-dependent oxidoreductase n=1 Tax=Arenibacter sp. 6A1 TaxID=2720391 RepID=UPI001446914E|nr:NAD(P)/FAD-dependent oxidoreductase [Arenibacter sp. 6A1]NKI25868.1 NAD(P)/FAD-dependent oxidoreductase [Arenibacter sp. 6A1]
MILFDVLIVGGGLAGLTSALDLQKKGYSVLVFEKLAYPHHKVCGEYLSKEVVPYLNYLGISLLDAVPVNNLLLSTIKGRTLQADLAMGGVGISRYTLDNRLYLKAREVGVRFVFGSVVSVIFQRDTFIIKTDKGTVYHGKVAIGAYGKRSALDKQLQRGFTGGKSPWLAVKAHYKLDGFPDNTVALHNFRGGYGGLSKTESGAVNFCYLVSYDSFKKEKSIAHFNKNVVSKNPLLGQFLEEAQQLFPAPETIGQVGFEKKSTVENHILMCGDTAGLIHPLCGNGMAMAIHSAKIAAETIDCFFREKTYNRNRMEKDYIKQWRNTFGRRLWLGRNLQSLLLHEKSLEVVVQLASKSPSMVKRLIGNTHGKTIRF